jgi:hypothetical protein
MADQPNYTRASGRQLLRERQLAAANRPPPVEDVQTLTRDVRDFEVSPSLDRGSRQTHGSELARRLKRLWNPSTPGDGSWMRRR